MEQQQKEDRLTAGYKTIFIVDPLKSERIQLAKFVKYEKFTVMTFVSVADCFKRTQTLSHDILIVALRREKSEIKHLLGIKEKHRKLPLILLLTPEAEEVNLVKLQEMGFTHVLKAVNNEKVKELAYDILAPDGLAPRTEIPHPVPI